MKLLKLRLFFLATVLITFDIWALAGTTGTPLGGMGTSYVVYDARTGDFAAGSIIPPGGGDMISDFQNRKSSSSGLHFYVGGESVDKATTTSEDSKCPLYTADFGKTDDIHFYLNAFGPYIIGDGDFNIQMITSPLAFFEITAVNEGTADVEVAAALEFANFSSTISGLIGGADNAVIDAESGNKGISFAPANYTYVTSNPNNTGNSYIMVGCSKEDATFSAGGKETFAASGTLSGTDGNCVAAKTTIAAGETITFKFVMAWWRSFESGQDRYSVGSNDKDNFYYHNFYQNSKEAAVFGMQHFDTVKNSVVGMVTRVLASNFPYWYKDRLLNNLYPLVHNSIWTKDGRAAFWEGGYGIIGTIDQAQHAAIWYVNNWPKNQWAELAYWIRSGTWQREDIKGQVHHDFNISPGVHFSPQESRFIAPWDQWDRLDYWFQPNTTDWSDLNSMLIFKAYELMIATGNRDSLIHYYPNILQTAKRLYQMGEEIGEHLPRRSRSTYDSENDDAPQYACGVALTAYQAIVEIAKFVGDDTTAANFQEIYDLARPEYKEKLFDDNYGALLNMGWAEGHVGGYAWARYFCFPPIQDQDFITAGCTRAWNIYSQSATLNEKVGGWHLYCYDHLGGALTGIGMPDTALKIHQWDYELYYQNLPDLVFWQSLFSGDASPGRYFSYMTAPNVWRSYFMFMGYLLDNAHNRLWIRPSLPSVMNKQIINAALPNPTGWGTLSYDETGAAINDTTNLVQSISITYDVPTKVSEIVLKNNTNGTTPFVYITLGGVPVEVTAAVVEDWGIEQNIRVSIAAPIYIGPDGAEIKVYTRYSPDGTITNRYTSTRTPLSILSSSVHAGGKISYSVDKTGSVSIELLHLNGAKVGTIMNNSSVSTGKHSFIWSGKTLEGNTLGTSNVYILRLKSSSKAVSRLVFNNLIK